VSIHVNNNLHICDVAKLLIMVRLKSLLCVVTLVGGLYPTVLIAQVSPPTWGCNIKYDHDAAGNRVSRYWYCWGSSILNDSLETLENDTLVDGGKSLGLLEEIVLSLHPNPASATVHIVLSAPINNARYRVLDVNGRVLLQGVFQGDRASIDIAGLAPGPYHAQVHATEELLSRSFIVE
jgi:hypothetical protein